MSTILTVLISTILTVLSPYSLYSFMSTALADEEDSEFEVPERSSAVTRVRKVAKEYFVAEARKNEGPFARDHLANERTFLAWLRTAMGLISVGIAIAKLSLLGGVRSQVSGVFFVLIGSLLLVYATARYFRIQRFLNEGLFEANKIGVWFVVGITGVATLFSILLALIP